MSSPMPSSAVEINDFPWTDSYLLGYPPMDDTHREFVVIVDAMLQSADAEFGTHLQAFADHAHRHFEQERAWMA